MSEYTSQERELLRVLLDDQRGFADLLQKVSKEFSDHHNANCARFMAHVPRQVEIAADEAAKASAWSEMVPRLKALQRRVEGSE